MPKGIYQHKSRLGETRGAIIKFLGRFPKNEAEYKHVWHVLFGKKSIGLVKQRQRHLAHGYGIPSKARNKCIFCVREGRMNG